MSITKNKTQPTWAEVIETVMKSHGYFATLKQLHDEAPKLKEHSGKTPNMTINYVVQVNGRFTKIMPGLWALSKYLDKLPHYLNPNIQKSDQEKTIITHALMQGYLIEIGNMKGYSTFTPDKNGLFLNKRLTDIISVQNCPTFTYDRVLQRVKYIDVIWFNEREYPANVIEVEHSTDFRNSLLKFLELQDFTTKMTIVASQERREQFEREIRRATFRIISRRIHFVGYDDVEKNYAASTTLASSNL